MKTNERLNKLPQNVQEDVLSVLKGWQGAYVERHERTGEYHVSTGIGITKEHNPWECVEYFDIDEIYTQEEQRANAEEYWRGVDMSSL